MSENPIFIDFEGGGCGAPENQQRTKTPIQVHVYSVNGTSNFAHTERYIDRQTRRRRRRMASASDPDDPHCFGYKFTTQSSVLEVESIQDMTVARGYEFRWMLAVFDFIFITICGLEGLDIKSKVNVIVSTSELCE